MAFTEERFLKKAFGGSGLMLSCEMLLDQEVSKLEEPLYEEEVFVALLELKFLETFRQEVFKSYKLLVGNHLSFQLEKQT